MCVGLLTVSGGEREGREGERGRGKEASVFGVLLRPAEAAVVTSAGRPVYQTLSICLTRGACIVVVGARAASRLAEAEIAEGRRGGPRGERAGGPLSLSLGAA